MGRLFGQIGVIVFVMAIGAFISVSFATRALEAAVAAVANRLRERSWLLIAAVMVLLSALGSTMGLSIETLGFYALFLPLMKALGYDRLVTASMIILGVLVGLMAATVNPFSIGVAANETGVSIGVGIGLRLLLWVVLTAMAVAWVLRYAARVRRDPAASLLGADADGELAGGGVDRAAAAGATAPARLTRLFTMRSPPGSPWMYCTNRGLPYNLVYGASTLHLVPRAAQCGPGSSARSQGWGWSEVAGAVTLFSRDEFERLEAGEFEAELALLAPPGIDLAA